MAEMAEQSTVNYPLRLKPKVKEVVWGGRWLADELHRPSQPDATLGESWEAYSASEITNGPWAGHTLGDLFTAYGAKLMGGKAAACPKFPLLVKFIDAHENLSIQVHPDDALAQKLEDYPYGKTEFWYVIAAAPGAEIVYGLNDAAENKEQLQSAMQSGELLKYCARVPVMAGDVVYIPARTVHALTEGVIVYELQQDCDITYRLYDWGRTGRELHIEKGLQAIDLSQINLKTTHPGLEESGTAGLSTVELIASEYFRSELIKVEGECSFMVNANSFALLSVLEGGGHIMSVVEGDFTSEPIAKGDTIFLPVALAYKIASENSSITLIRSGVA